MTDKHWISVKLHELIRDPHPKVRFRMSRPDSSRRRPGCVWLVITHGMRSKFRLGGMRDHLTPNAELHAFHAWNLSLSLSFYRAAGPDQHHDSDVYKVRACCSLQPPTFSLHSSPYKRTDMYGDCLDFAQEVQVRISMSLMFRF